MSDKSIATKAFILTYDEDRTADGNGHVTAKLYVLANAPRMGNAPFVATEILYSRLAFCDVPDKDRDQIMRSKAAQMASLLIMGKDEHGREVAMPEPVRVVPETEWQAMQDRVAKAERDLAEVTWRGAMAAMRYQPAHYRGDTADAKRLADIALMAEWAAENAATLVDFQHEYGGCTAVVERDGRRLEIWVDVTDDTYEPVVVCREATA